MYKLGISLKCKLSKMYKYTNTHEEQHINLSNKFSPVLVAEAHSLGYDVANLTIIATVNGYCNSL